MNSLLRRKEGSPAVTPLQAQEPAAPPPACSNPQHSLPHKAKSLPALGASALLEAESSDRMGGSGGVLSGGGGGRGARAGGGRGLLKLCVAAALATLLIYHFAPEAGAHEFTSFVRVEGTQFMLDCRPFYVAGFNVETAPDVARNGGGMGNRLSGPAGAPGRKDLRALFEQAAAAGLNVVRTFAHTTNPGRPLQVAPGQYDEAAFRGLDAVIAEAQRAGLRVILSLADNWKYRGGVDEFVDWSETMPKRDPKFPAVVNTAGDVSTEGLSPEQLKYENERKAFFFKDEGARKLYRDHARKVLERVNSVTGRRYSDDPTIMAFNLLNEPRCSSYETADCTDLVTRWVLEMAQHVKSLDQSHLLTLGSEGFWGERDVVRDSNPGAPSSDWASKAGQDNIANSAMPQIDYVSFHSWEDNWRINNASFHREWINKHLDDCQAMLRKPCLLEEFGKKLELGKSGQPSPADVAALRDPLFLNIYDAVEQGMSLQKPMGGSLFWRWGLDARSPNAPGQYGVLPDHSTYRYVSQHAQRVRSHMLTHPPSEQCGLDCWVGDTGLGGMIRRCEHRPSVCADHRARRQYQKAPAAGAPAPPLVAEGEPVFASQADCCLPGLGAFPQGCSVTWF